MFFATPAEVPATGLLMSLFETVPVDAGVMDLGGELYRSWHPSHGLDAADALLAAFALITGGKIHTLNVKHFPMPDLVVEQGWQGLPGIHSAAADSYLLGQEDPMKPEPAKTAAEYIAGLPPDRRAAIKAVRKAIKASLPKGYKEMILYGMISYVIPLSRYPVTYNGQPLTIASLGSRKSHMAVYLMAVYANPAVREWFKASWARTGKKLDMGGSCVRFKKLDDLPVELIAEAIARVPPERFIQFYEKARKLTRG
jgi:hypothetical protein